MAKVNLKEIALRAEVSISTVSRVVNDPDQVNPETRDRVYQVMRELDYRPGFTEKQSENKSGAGVVAVVSPVVETEFFSDLLKSLEEELHPHGIYPLMVNAREDFSLSSFMSRELAWLDLADMVVIVNMDIDERVRDYLDAKQIPVALVHTRSPWYFSVLNNNYLGGYDAACYLWEKGYRKPGIICWPDNPGTFQRERLLGFVSFMQEKGLGVESIPREESRISLEGGAGATKRILEAHPELDVLFYSCDTMAMGGMEWCREQGMKVPGDIGIMGFDDIRMATSLNLTTMKQFIPAKARAVADYLIRRRDEALPPEHPGEMTMTPVLVERGSC